MKQIAVRIIGVEYVQNLPILLGLMLAIHTQDWAGRLFLLVLGAVGTALTITLTEQVKLRNHTPQKPTPIMVNVFTFLAGSIIYVGYNQIIRRGVLYPVMADVVLGLLLGLAMGLAQGYGRGEGRLNAGDVAHVGGLMGAGSALCSVIGAVAESWSPIVAAIVLCIPMTLIIVRMDYWPLIMAEHS